MSIYDKYEYYEIVKNILEHEEFLKRKTYKHHGKISVYEHSINVSKKSYLFAKKHNFDYKEAAIGGLLHDFYYEPWGNKKEKTKFFKMHGFSHASEAKINSKKYFGYLITKKTEDIIEKHMFPLNIRLPKYKESWLITIVDKIVSLEVLTQEINIIKKKEYNNNV